MQRSIQSVSLEKHNAVFITFEVVWSGVFAIVSSFVPIYAIHLGATNTEIGLLTSVPALLTILVSIPAARFLEKLTNPTHWTFGSLFVHRTGYLLLVLVPLAYVFRDHQGIAVVAIIAVSSVPLLIYNIGIWPFYIRVIRPEQRATLFSTQHILSNIVTGSGVFLVGFLLDVFVFPINYQVMIAAGVILSLLSLYCFNQVRVPSPFETEQQKDKQSNKTNHQANSLRMLLNLRTDYGRAVFNQVFQYIGIWAATPLMTIYTVKILSASNSWVGLNSSILFFGQIAGWLIARKMIQRFGEPQSLKWTSQLPVLQPLLIGLSPALTPILFITALNGILHPSYSLSHNNILLKTLPTGREHEGIAVYNTINRLGVFICPIIGVAIAEWIGDVRVVLLACGLISLLGSLSFHIWPILQPSLKQQMSTP